MERNIAKARLAMPGLPVEEVDPDTRGPDRQAEAAHDIVADLVFPGARTRREKVDFAFMVGGPFGPGGNAGSGRSGVSTWSPRGGPGPSAP